MSNLRKPMSIAMTTAIASASLAAGSLFSMDALAHGYLQDAGKAKPGHHGHPKPAREPHRDQFQ